MKFFITSLFLVFTSFVFSQDLVLIRFADKPSASYYFENPTEMLTQKALDRRAKYGIELDILDVPAEQNYVDQVLALGIEPIAVSKWFNGVFAWCTEEQISDAEALSSVLEVESFVRDPGGKYNPIDKKMSVLSQDEANDLSPENFNYGATELQVTQLNLNFLHSLGFTGDGMTIAVLDNGYPGVDTEDGFAYLRDNGQIKGTFDFVNGVPDVYYSGGTHGTVVLSTMAGYVEGEYVGTAIDADYYLFITENNSHEMPDEEVNWITAAEESDRLGVDVINTSLGYNNYDDSRYNYVYENMDGETTYISRGAQIAAEKGIMVVVSAGNSGLQDWHYVTAPADAEDVFTIGAVDWDGNMAGFSSWGPTPDGRIKPDVDALGSYASVINLFGEITYSSGTSFSSPIMAGAMACLIQAFPEKHPADLRQKVRESADSYNNPTDHRGYGIPDFGDAYDKCLGVKDYDLNEYVTVYPNPTSDLLNIKSEKRIQKMQLISFEGKIVRNLQPQNRLDLSGMPSGVYILKVLLENGKMEVKKVIKK